MGLFQDKDEYAMNMVLEHGFEYPGKIEAIKRIREKFGISLREAMFLIENAMKKAPENTNKLYYIWVCDKSGVLVCHETKNVISCEHVYDTMFHIKCADSESWIVLEPGQRLCKVEM